MASPRPKMTRKQSLLSLFQTPLTSSSPLTPETIGAPRDPVVLSRADPMSPCPLCGGSSTDSPAVPHSHAHPHTHMHVDVTPTPSTEEDQHSYRRRPRPKVSQQRANELNFLALSMAPLTPEVARAESAARAAVVASPLTPPIETAPAPHDSPPAPDIPRVPSLTMTDLSASTNSITSIANTLLGSLVIDAGTAVRGQNSQAGINGGQDSAGNGGGSTGTGGTDNSRDSQPRLVHIDKDGKVQSVWFLGYGEDGQLVASVGQEGTLQIVTTSTMPSVQPTSPASTLVQSPMVATTTPLLVHLEGPSSVRSAETTATATTTTPLLAHPASVSSIGSVETRATTTTTIPHWTNTTRTARVGASTPVARSELSVYSSASPSTAHQIDTLIAKAQTLLELADVLKLQLEERRKEDTSAWGSELCREWINESRRIKREMRAAEQEADDWFAAVRALREDSDSE